MALTEEVKRKWAAMENLVKEMTNLKKEVTKDAYERGFEKGKKMIEYRQAINEFEHEFKQRKGELESSINRINTSYASVTTNASDRPIGSMKEIYEEAKKEFEDGFDNGNIVAKAELYDVFICYSSKDIETIESLSQDFKKEKIKYWLDEEQIKGGDRVTQKIAEGLDKSKCVLACLSENLNNSGWAKVEYGSIINKELRGNSKRRVIPLKLDDCDIPLILVDLKRFTYSNKTEFKKLIRDLKE